MVSIKKQSIKDALAGTLGKIGFQKGRKQIFIGVIIIVLFMVGVFIFFSWSKKLEKKSMAVQRSKACSESAGNIISVASLSMATDKVAQLKPTVDKIQTLKNYENDPNCLAILITYNINISSAAEARKYYNGLTALNVTRQDYDVRLSTYMKSTDQLKQIVEMLEKHNEVLINKAKATSKK
jgi:hypothetical protein